MAFEKVKGGKADPNGSGRVWAGQVTLSSGTATVAYADELPGVGGDLPEEPVIVCSSKTADRAYPSSVGATQATISGTGDATVNVWVHEQGGQ